MNGGLHLSTLLKGGLLNKYRHINNLFTGWSAYVGPFFVKEPPSRVDFSNETGAFVDCMASGTPPPSVTWLTSEGEPVLTVPHTLELLSNGSLLFHPFNPGAYRHDLHKATYRCAATNSVGRVLSRDVHINAGQLLRASHSFLVIPSIIHSIVGMPYWMSERSDFFLAIANKSVVCGCVTVVTTEWLD